LCWTPFSKERKWIP